MLNNAIDYPGGSEVRITAERRSDRVLLRVHDDGEGIFDHITRLMGLEDSHEAILELSKGKLNTDPDHHTGEGIFFTLRAFDAFFIVSGDLMFNHRYDPPTDIMNHAESDVAGTLISMMLVPDSNRSLASVFGKFTDQETYDFSRTVVPVRLALYEGDQLISRSQAKRIMHRVEHFRNVILDFAGVEMVGRSFADEIFRVFANHHPQIRLQAINMNEGVRKSVNRVLSRSGSTESERT